MDKKQKVRELLKSIETGDTAPAAVVSPRQYTQHNLAVADGLAGFGALLSQLPPGSARVDTQRVFEDGDFVFAHTSYEFFGPKVGFDVFRFEGDQIVEHWDNLQERPASPNPSGHTMIDGPTEAGEPAGSDVNKARVREFVDTVLVGGQFDRATEYLAVDGYTQHNPQIADGLDGLQAAVTALAAAGIEMRYDRVHRVLGEGDFVLTLSEGAFAGDHVGFYDLFRVQAGRITEHWDTIEPIPPREEWNNDNGKF